MLLFFIMSTYVLNLNISGIYDGIDDTIVSPTGSSIDSPVTLSILLICFYPMMTSQKLCLTGVSIHEPRQRNSTYIQTVRRSIYEIRRPEHLQSPIRRYERRPQGPPPRPCNMESCPDTALLYSTDTATSTSTVRHDHCEHCTAASRALPLPHLVSDAISIIDIRSSVLAAISDWIRLTCFRFDLTHLFLI